MQKVLFRRSRINGDEKNSAREGGFNLQLILHETETTVITPIYLLVNTTSLMTPPGPPTRHPRQESLEGTNLVQTSKFEITHLNFDFNFLL